MYIYIYIYIYVLYIHTQDQHVNRYDVLFQLDQNMQSLFPRCGLSESENKVKVATLYPSGKHSIRTIAPKENCPQVRVWVRFRVRFGVGGQFFSGAIVLEPLEHITYSH